MQSDSQSEMKYQLTIHAAFHASWVIFVLEVADTVVGTFVLTRRTFHYIIWGAPNFNYSYLSIKRPHSIKRPV